MNKNLKRKKIILTTIVCLLITIGATVGIAFYNYYGYIGYKGDFLDDYFDVENNKKESNQTKIENALRFTSNGYVANPGKITFYDIGEDGTEYNEITEKKLENGAMTNSYFSNGTLHLQNYFDLNIYAVRNTVVNAENSSDAINHYLFFSNIQYNYLTKIYPDFNLKNFFITYIEGTDEAAKQEIDALIQEIKKNGDYDIGALPSIWSYSLLTEEGDTYASYALDDNIDSPLPDTIEYPRIYRTNITKVTLSKVSPTGESKTEVQFNNKNGVSFLLCVFDDENNISETVIRGTYTPELVDGEPLTPENMNRATHYQIGYNESFKNPHYKTFIMRKILISSSITFVVVGLFTSFLGFIWSIDLRPQPNTGIDEKQKKKKNRK